MGSSLSSHRENAVGGRALGSCGEWNGDKREASLMGRGVVTTGVAFSGTLSNIGTPD